MQRDNLNNNNLVCSYTIYIFNVKKFFVVYIYTYFAKKPSKKFGLKGVGGVKKNVKKPLF